MPKSKGPWIQTFTKKRFHLLQPHIDDVDILDIAHALSLQPRFNGQSSEPYSVSQHSIMVCHQCSALAVPNNASPRDKAIIELHGLLHDASEAYISDVNAPLKHSGRMDEYIKIEEKIQSTILKKFGIRTARPPIIKAIDKRVLATEAKALMAPLLPEWETYCNENHPFNISIIPWQARAAEKEFLALFNQLMIRASIPSRS